MEWVETTARTVEDAKEAALDQLGVAEEDAEFEILEEPRPGLFGRVRGEARVRARVRPTQPRSKEDRRDRRRRPRPDRSEGPKPGAPSVRPETVATEEPEDEPDDTPEAEAAPAVRSSSRRSPKAEGKEDMDEAVPLDVQGDAAAQFVEGLVDSFELSAVVATHPIDEDTVEIRVTGEDLGLLIGPKGATLAAVQELTRTVVQRKLRAHNGRILVDVAGYRQKRKAALERFTREVADQVKASGERRILEPMTAPDRKVVHDTVNTIDGVSTTSEGEEPRRRVVIMPNS